MRTAKKRKKFSRALNGIFSTVKPTSKYPSTYAGFPEDTDNWSCGQWKTYYQNNKAIIGKAEALKLIEVDMGNIGEFADGQYCRYDCGFIDYFKGEGLEGGNIFSKIYCAGEGTVDVVSSGVDAVGGIADFVTDVARNKLLLLGAAAGAYYLYNKHSK